MASIKDTLTSERSVKIELGKNMELEEIYEKMNQRASDFKMPFKLKKVFSERKLNLKEIQTLNLS